MSPELQIVLSALAGIGVGLISKIVFDWFKGNRNNKQYKLLEQMLQEIKQQLTQ